MGRPWEGWEAVCWDLAQSIIGCLTESGRGPNPGGPCWPGSSSIKALRIRIPTPQDHLFLRHHVFRFHKVAAPPSSSSPWSGLELHTTECLLSCYGSTCPRELGKQRNHVTVLSTRLSWLSMAVNKLVFYECEENNFFIFWVLVNMFLYKLTYFSWPYFYPSADHPSSCFLKRNQDL